MSNRAQTEFSFKPVTDLPDIYLRYYAGHKGLYGHEFIEFEVKPDGYLRYANNTKYRREGCIHKECRLSPQILNYIKHLIVESKIITCDDSSWPLPDKIGCSELEIILEKSHISFTTSNIGSITQINGCEDAANLAKYFYLIQDLKGLVMELMSMHFKLQPLQQ